jgi:serine/threonine protein kinase
VAVKILADNWVRHADVRERFLSEARLLRRIESRRAVRVHDVDVADYRPYFVMYYVRGGRLADRVGQLRPDEAVPLAVEAAEAVHVLSEAGFVHRDIKPTNLLLDQTCKPARVLVADLGSVKRIADATGFTVTTGTSAYMAPRLRVFAGRGEPLLVGVSALEERPCC